MARGTARTLGCLSQSLKNISLPYINGPWQFVGEKRNRPNCWPGLLNPGKKANTRWALPDCQIWQSPKETIQGSPTACWQRKQSIGERLLCWIY